MADARELYSVTREWGGGFELGAQKLKSLDAKVCELLSAASPSSVSLQLSNSTAIQAGALDDIFREDNSRGRLFEILSITWHGGAERLSRESCTITFAKRGTQPAIVMQVRSASRETMALIAREIESRLEDVVIPPSIWRRVITPPRQGEVSVLAYITMLLPIGAAIWATRQFDHITAQSAEALLRDIAATESMRDISLRIFKYGMFVNELNSNRLVIAMLALGAAVVIWAFEARTRAGEDLASSRHFLINDYATRYVKHAAFQDRLFWSGMVAFAVSALASVLIWWLTRV